MEDEDEDRGEQEQEQEDKEEEESTNKTGATSKECLEALKIVRAYCQSRQFNSAVYESIQQVEYYCVLDITNSGKVQKRITDFFMK